MRFGAGRMGLGGAVILLILSLVFVFSMIMNTIALFLQPACV